MMSGGRLGYVTQNGNLGDAPGDGPGPVRASRGARYGPEATTYPGPASVPFPILRRRRQEWWFNVSHKTKHYGQREEDQFTLKS
jgi:hypothetical protein